ncbi:hypothetical protein VCHA34P116_10651 [Vibrio chagasii]|nr:hypothetical protein VCHA32P90_10650 [Vibrio chagasii]CAH6854192.1 hypothetical protein VCHA34P116_10651 [Vibrio chagasii]CAH7112483.1 hypothetical protein VCHA37P194_10651 [Vibrio chagasii]CAH7305657.1 hypothetical protein VCHA48O429_10650 [Vibrio chagasii]
MTDTIHAMTFVASPLIVDSLFLSLARSRVAAFALLAERQAMNAKNGRGDAELTSQRDK